MASEGIVIERSQHAQQFVIIGNAEARDGRVSLRAHGLHAYLLSLPPGWRVTTTDIAKMFPEGRDAIRTALAELVTAGYVTKVKHQDARGRWSTVMTVHDKPQPKTETFSDDFATETGDGKPGVGEPGVGFPGAIQKTVNENGKDQKMVQGRASRRGHASGATAKRAPGHATRTVDQVIAEVRKAIIATKGQAESDELNDSEVLSLYFEYGNPASRQVNNLVAYMTSILDNAPYLDTFLQNVEPVCRDCRKYESRCRCRAKSAA